MQKLDQKKTKAMNLETTDRREGEVVVKQKLPRRAALRKILMRLKPPRNWVSEREMTICSYCLFDENTKSIVLLVEYRIGRLLLKILNHISELYFKTAFRLCRNLYPQVMVDYFIPSVVFSICASFK